MQVAGDFDRGLAGAKAKGCGNEGFYEDCKSFGV